MTLTANQRLVLAALATAGTPLFGRDFAPVATVTTGRWEWAGPILTSLLAKGFVAKGTTKTHKGFAWSLTAAGQAVLAQPDTPANPTDRPLTPTMRAELARIAAWDEPEEPYESAGPRGVQNALERRGLVTIQPGRGAWRVLALTPSGRDVLQS